jgi:hypothetical protein
LQLLFLLAFVSPSHAGIAERIEMLLGQAGIGKDDLDPEEYDAILEGLEEGKRHQLEACIDRMAKQEAARGEILYLGNL